MKNQKRVREIFHDAELLYKEGLKELKNGKIRDAAEKVWGATLRATSGLIFSKIGKELRDTHETSRWLQELAKRDGEVRKLIDRYYTRQGYLHGDCFYLGLCEPRDEVERRIRETDKYIEDAKRLAGIGDVRL